MSNFLKENKFKVTGTIILIIVVVLVCLYLFKESHIETTLKKNTIENPVIVKSSQEILIEGKGLPEFNAENNTINTVSDQDKNLAQEMMPIFKEMGDGEDNAKNKEAIIALSKVIEKYKEYPDAYLLRATISFLVSDNDYQKILSDIDNAIKYHSSTKYSSAYDSTGGMYGLRAKVDILSGNYQQAVNDLEIAIKTDPSNTNEVFNTGGVKPGDDSNPTTLQKNDLDLLITKYPDDYRVYIFRGLFYGSFTTFDEKYFTSSNQDLKQALKINPQSALVNFLLGYSAQKIGFWTKAAWSDVSDLTGAKGGFKEQVHEIALNYFKEAIKLDPQFAKAYSQVAESLYSLKRYSEAIPYYDKVIEIDPNDAGAYNDRGLAKTYINDYYSATSDFSDAIRLKKTDQSSLENTYENRANAFIKASNYDRAINDYSSAIGLKFASTVFIMSLPQIRNLYPELSDISDNDLLEGLRQKYFPNMSSADFVGNYKDSSKKIGCDFVFTTLYSNRADAYVSKGDLRGAAREYARANHCDEKYAATLDRWKTISKTSDSEYSVDIQTLDFSQGNIVSLWTKVLNSDNQSYSQNNYQIDCTGRKMKLTSATNYDSLGNVLFTGPVQDWQSIVPDSIGEIFYNGMCKQGIS